MSRLLAPLRKGLYCISGGQALLRLEDLIRWSPAEVSHRERRNSTLDSVIEVILFTFCISDPDVMIFRHDLLVGNGIFYLAI